MSHVPSARKPIPVSWLPGAVALLPAVLVAAVVLLQGSKLSATHATVRRASIPSSARGDALNIGWFGALLVLVAGIAMSVLLARELRRPREPAAALPRERPTRDDGLVAQDRAGLVAACVDLVDQVPSEALRHRMRDALSEAGVETVSAQEGDAFDSDRYRAVDRVPTKDPSLHNRIAGTERPGYIDRGRTLREPEVLVYRLQEPRSRA